MKMIQLSIILLAFISISLVIIFPYCNKEASHPEQMSNAPLTIHVSDILDIRASDVLTTRSAIKRKIEYINRMTKLVIDSFIISMNCKDTSKLFMKTIMDKSFTGTFLIESANEVLWDIYFENGKILSSKITSINKEGYKSNLVVTCKLGLIHSCVSNAINNMGIFEYAVCLNSAPSCYALLWAGCSFNYCITGEQR